MNSQIKQIVHFAIPTVFIVWAIRFVYLRFEYFQQIFSIEWEYLAGLLLAICGVHFINAIMLGLLVSTFHVRLAIGEMVSVSVFSSLINLVSPLRGGAAFRAYYLNQRHSLSLKHFVSVFGGQYILNFFFNCLIALIILLYIFLVHDISIPILFVFFSALGAVLLYVVFFAPSIPETKRVFWGKIARTINSWDRIRNDKSTLYRFSVLILLRTLLLGAALKLAFSASELYITYPNALLLGILGSFATLISITPGGFGIVEGILMLSSPLIGTGSEEMLIAALIHRTMLTFTLLLLWPYSWVRLKINH